MYQLLFIVLLILNLSVFAWNYVIPEVQQPREIPLTDKGVRALELVKDIEVAAFDSSLAPTNSSCYSLGPYNSERTAQIIRNKVSDFGLAVTVRPMKSMDTLNFLVYIPAFPSFSDAQKVTEDMAKFDVKDALIINDGPYKNAISLGFFTNLNKAKRHAEYIRYLGYDARYTEQRAAREVFWVDYDEPFGSDTPVLAWTKAIDASLDVQRIPRACADSNTL